jgi:hypothetical protein
VIGRRERERGKAEDYGVMLATVTLTWRSSGDLWEWAEVANAAHLGLNQSHRLVEEVQGGVAGWRT